MTQLEFKIIITFVHLNQCMGRFLSIIGQKIFIFLFLRQNANNQQPTPNKLRTKKTRPHRGEAGPLGPGEGTHTCI